MEKKDFLYLDLSLTYRSNNTKRQMDEYCLIMQDGDIRKAVLLYYPQIRFSKHMKYYKYIKFN